MMFEQNKAQLAADSQRAEAKQLMLLMFGIATGESNGMVERIVDCLIGAAMLEVVAIQAAAMRPTSAPDNAMLTGASPVELPICGTATKETNDV